MPKTHRDFPKRLDISATPEMWLQMIAIAYYHGYGGTYAPVGRNFIAAGIRAFLAGLGEGDRKRWDEIYENVKLRMAPDVQ